MLFKAQGYTIPKNRSYIGTRYSARGVALCLSFFLAACSSTPVKDAEIDERTNRLPDQTRTNLQIAAVGDIMLGSDYPINRLPADDLSLLGPVADTLRQADITFGNLEGSLLDGGEPVKQCGNPQHCYLFRSPSRYSAQLKQAGFDVLSLANNHARDFGEEGRSSSMASLEGTGIAHTGREGDVALIHVKGTKVAVIAYAPFKGANDMLALAAADEQIRALSSKTDIVIVSFHGGAEGEEHSHIPFASEFYYGEDRGDVVKFAHLAVDAGADLVIGHGPHVPRAIELYHERLIAYSLGNFATHWGVNVQGSNGIAPILMSELDADGRFVAGRIISAKQVRLAGTLPDESQTASRIIRELTRADFPETPLLIDQRGNIRLNIPSAVSGAPPKPVYAGDVSPLANAK